ncbi:MAG: hypothetical protein ABSC56_13510 [Solirubrobacteraceae bacterium]|jgi:hypothetical protein
MSTPEDQAPQGEPSEEELRAALEEQLRQITAFDVIVQTAISLVNLAGRRLGLTEDTEQERDLAQVRDAIDGVRALLPILERGQPPAALAPLRDAVSSLQMEYARLVGATPAAPATEAAAAPGEPAPGADGPGPAQRSGRLWVPGSGPPPK